MIQVIKTKRNGLEVFTASIVVDGRIHLESVHMSEQGARSWILNQLNKLAGKAA